MHIGELAKQAGLNIQSVRFYERRGLLPPPPRSSSGYRCYSGRDLETIRFIKRAQNLGFTLQEIAQLLELHQPLTASPVPTPHRKSSRETERLVQLARERLSAIEQKIEILNGMRNQLVRFLRAYQRSRKLACPAAKQ
jgi:DNA-binding transcriptional MerR regulator